MVYLNLAELKTEVSIDLYLEISKSNLRNGSLSFATFPSLRTRSFPTDKTLAPFFQSTTNSPRWSTFQNTTTISY